MQTSSSQIQFSVKKRNVALDFAANFGNVSLLDFVSLTNILIYD